MLTDGTCCGHHSLVVCFTACKASCEIKEIHVAQMVKNLPAVQETWVHSLGWQDPLQQGIVTHSSILAWRIPWQRRAWWATVHEMQRVRQDSATNTCTFFSELRSLWISNSNLMLYLTNSKTFFPIKLTGPLPSSLAPFLPSFLPFFFFFWCSISPLLKGSKKWV